MTSIEQHMAKQDERWGKPGKVALAMYRLFNRPTPGVILRYAKTGQIEYRSIPVKFWKHNRKRVVLTTTWGTKYEGILLFVKAERPGVIRDMVKGEIWQFGQDVLVRVITGIPSKRSTNGEEYLRGSNIASVELV